MTQGNQATGRETIYDDKDGIPEVWLTRAAWTAVVGAIVTIAVLIGHLLDRCDVVWKLLFAACWIGWIFGPPLWFAFEYYVLFKKHGPSGSFEAFKYGQELSYRAWLGVAAVLSVIASETLK